MGKDDSSNPPNGWSVLLFFAKQFPIVILAAGFVGGSIYLVLEFSERATQATEKAEQLRATATSQALEQLNQSNLSLIEVAKSIQTIVGGQIENMKELEELRARHAARSQELQAREEKLRKSDLEGQILALENQKIEAEKALRTTEQRLATHVISRVFDAARSALTKNEYHALTTARSMLRTLGSGNATEREELERIAKEDPEWRMKLLALDTLMIRFEPEGAWLQEFSELVQANRISLGVSESNLLFDSYDLPYPVRKFRTGLIALLLRESQETHFRANALGYFRFWPESGPKLDCFVDRQQFIETLRITRDLILDPEAPEYARSSGLDAAWCLEPSAYRVWVAELAKAPVASIQTRARQHAESARSRTDTPLKPVTEELRDYWMEPQLTRAARDYPAAFVTEFNR